MKKTHYKELPENYELDFKLDSTSKKMKNAGTIYSLIVLLVVLSLCIGIRHLTVGLNIELPELGMYLIKVMVFVVAMLLYVVLHEVVHGISYKILTKEKLTFGIKLPVAYCGVKDIYTTKKTSLIALLSPFVVFTIIFLIPLFFISNSLDYLIVSYLLSMHISGCIFDLYDTYLLVVKYKNKDVLVYDDGPTQSFYVKKN